MNNKNEWLLMILALPIVLLGLYMFAAIVGFLLHLIFGVKG